MPTEAQPFSQLVAEHVGEGRDLSYRAFEARAVDPASGYQPSHQTVWKIANGRDVQVTPQLVGAIAAGLGIPLPHVQAAAALQFTGYTTTDLGGPVALHAPGAQPSAAAREAAARWIAEEEADETDPDAP